MEKQSNQKNESPIVVRQGRFDDLGIYYRLTNRDLSEIHKRPCEISDFSKQVVERDLGSRRLYFGIGQLKGDDVGYWKGEPDEINSNIVFFGGGIYVLPEFRNQGVGKALKQHQMDFAKSQGYSHLRTIIDNDNIPSLKISSGIGAVLESKGKTQSRFILKLGEHSK
tara:strand:- start:139 stop:639 length:501 start_codon:yes stop_codon:yes gene_type:complete